ncbi:MAG TPA: carboxypeptidase-like regulatory domain-containing protein, partial [Membranihabitans sp.]|nr:carboxypeptidase-like regulatory domain-containing protein [Membranihabitans sp.]
MKHLIFPLVWICLSIPLFGQHGLVRGTLYDGETGETIPYGTVFLENDPGTGTSTDLDGAFELRLQPGTYNISFSYIGYSTTTVENVTVNEGNIQIINPKISTAHQTLTEIVVTSTQLSNTQSALLTIKRKSPNVIDGVSRELFSKAGDGDAGSAIKRVTG